MMRKRVKQEPVNFSELQQRLSDLTNHLNK